MRNIDYLKTLLFGVFLCYFNVSSAQLFVTNATVPPFTPVNLIENVFLGSGVDVINVSYTGDPIAVGYFDGVFSNVNLDRGILMTTGTSNYAVGPNDDMGGGTANQNSGVSDPDLVAVTNNTVNDAAVYTIDFIPYSDTLRFRYVFASEEYDEFVCSGVNDGFGFFISGPGYAGPFTNGAENIALIPGTTTPVTIDNVNNGGGGCTPTNVSYYVNNDNGVTVEYDAFTTVLEAVAVVVPCSQYKIKLAIGDAGDDIYDSGVFLEANSFGTNALNVSVNTISPDSTIVEGCSSAIVAFELDEPTTFNYPIGYNVWGTAINGVDYEMLPGMLEIPAGQDSVALVFTPIEDNMVEGLETIVVEIQTNACKLDTFFLYVDDNGLIQPVVENDSICPGEPISLDGTLNVSLPTSSTFTNNTAQAIPDNDILNPITSDINILGAVPSVITNNTILSICIDITHQWDSDLDIYLITPGGQVLELATDLGPAASNFANTCFTLDATDFIKDIVAADAPFTGNYQPEGQWTDIYGGASNGTWTLQVSDDANGFTGTLNSWSITIPPTYSLSYSWSPTNDLSCIDCPVTVASPSVETTYWVTATDSYGCFTEDSVLISMISDLAAPIINCSVSGTTVTFDWGAVPGASGYEVNVDNTGWVPANGTLTHTVAGSIGQTISIEVQGLSATCNALSGTGSCMIPNCTFNSSINSSNNISCNGGMDGGIVVTASNGTSPYQYQLNSGMVQANGSFINLPAGMYTIDITDDLGCVTAETITLLEPDALGITMTGTSITCFAANDGTASATISGGTMPYTYAWGNSVQTTATINNLSPNTYQVTVTDTNGCTITSSYVVTEPALLTTSLSVTAVNCNGESNGQISSTVVGGTAGYSYNWSNNFTTQDISNLSPGIYVLTVTDVNSCFATSSGIITEPPAVTLSTSTTSASCNGGTDGTATVSASNGVGAYTYLWDTAAGNQMTATANNLSFGNYSVTVTDSNGCGVTASASVGELSSVVYTLSATGTNCFGDMNGTATANVSSGTTPLTYEWNTVPSQNTPAATGLIAGTYEVTITDADGCSTVDNIEVTGPDQIAIIIQTTDISCNGIDDGSASISVSGGTPGYTYLWNDALAQTTSTINSLGSGTYIVTVTDANNCTETASVFIAEPVVLSSTISGTNVSCNGGDDGIAIASGSGGTPGYTYEWNNLATTSSITNLTSGNYSVTITDTNGCSTTNSLFINQPTGIVISMVTPSPTNCAGNSDGSITISANGGTAPLSYSIDNGTTYQTGNVFNGVSAGTYSIVVQDANNCEVNSTTTVVDPTALTVMNITSAPESCFGNDGTATVSVNGGIGTYTYSWNPSGQATAAATGLTTGNYSILVTDANGCNITSSVNVGGPTPIVLTTTSSSASCSGSSDGSATVTATGGTSGFTYQWDASAGNQSTSTATNLGAGSYSITVYDMSGCSETALVSITQPNALLASTFSISVACFGEATGSASVSATGGTLPYTYQWDAQANNQTTTIATGLVAGNYMVSVIDNNNCTSTSLVSVNQPVAPLIVSTISSTSVSCNGGNDGSISVNTQGGTPGYSYVWNDTNSQTTPVAVGLVAGNYIVTITDSNGCATTGVSTVIEPLALSVTVTQQGASCNGGVDGSATAMASGGTGNYTYSWNTGQSGATANGLTGGNTYTVTAIDDNNCSIVETITIDNPAPIQLAMSVQNAACFGGDSGSILTIPNGGTAPYSYEWSTNTNGQSSQQATGLEAGIYGVTVTDTNGCKASESVQVTHPIEFNWNFTNEEVGCYSDSTGSASIQVFNGSPGYQYQWNDSNQQTGATASGLVAGNYIVTVTDSQGCTFTTDTNVGEPGQALSLNFTPFTVTCYGGRDGFIEVFGIGGTPPYAYSIDNNYYNSANNINGLMAGTYPLFVKDSRDCIYETSVTVSEPPLFVVNAGNDTLIEYGESIELLAMVNNNPLNNDYSWTTQSPAGSLSCTDCPDPISTPEYDITYFIEATNQLGCVAKDEITIRVEEKRRVFVASAFTPNEDGNNDFFYVQGGHGTVSVVSLRVFDRWGELVFQTGNTPLNEPSSGWDGTFKSKKMNSGVFAWIAEVSFYDDVVLQYQGDVTLLK